MIIFMFASGLFGILGLPMYLILGVIVWGYYNIVNYFGFLYYI